MTPALRRALAAALLSLLVLSGCTNSPEDDPQTDLRARVELVRSAVEARDPETALSALNGLRDAVVEHRLNGDLEFERAQSIITAANHVEEHLGELDRLPPEEEPTEPEATEGEDDEDEDDT